MSRAKTTSNGSANGAVAARVKKPGTVHLSDLTVEGREFELGGELYTTKSPITLTLPEIAKVDGMGKKINQWLPAFGKGEYDGIPMEEFQQLLIDMVVEVSNVPEEVAKTTQWWQQLLIIGLFQTTAGMDFLEKQLPQLGNMSADQKAKIQEAMQEAKSPETETSTSPAP